MAETLVEVAWRSFAYFLVIVFVGVIWLCACWIDKRINGWQSRLLDDDDGDDGCLKIPDGDRSPNAQIEAEQPIVLTMAAGAGKRP